MPLAESPSVPRLIGFYGAQPVGSDIDFDQTPPDKVLVCVFESFWVDAARVCYDEDEFRECRYDPHLYKTWLLMDRAVVAPLVPVIYANIVAGNVRR